MLDVRRRGKSTESKTESEILKEDGNDDNLKTT